MNKLQELPAGNFSDWLERTRNVLIDNSWMEVPCGDCCACCKSSYFIHIQPQETETMRQIPAELLFPAPGRPPGFKLMGYDQNGRCPMLINVKCSIYEYRPLTCRNYDCRVLTAALSLKMTKVNS